MANPFMNIKNKFKDILTSPSEDYNDDVEEEYVELNTGVKEGVQTKITVRPFVIDDFSDIKGILDTLRDGYTIGIVNIRPLREKDMAELKRAINKLKKTCDAIDGDIAGFDDDWIVVTPSFAQIYRAKVPKLKRESNASIETYEDDIF